MTVKSIAQVDVRAKLEEVIAARLESEIRTQMTKKVKNFEGDEVPVQIFVAATDDEGEYRGPAREKDIQAAISEALESAEVGWDDLSESIVEAIDPLQAPEYKLEEVSATYSMATTDYMIEADSTSGAFTITLPELSTVPTGKVYMVTRVGGSGDVTVEGFGTETIEGELNVVLSATYERAHIVSGSTEWLYIGSAAGGGGVNYIHDNQTGNDHIYPLDETDKLNDVGSGAIDLVLSASAPGYRETVPGSYGAYLITASTHARINSANVARTGDVYYEGIFSEVATAGGTTSMIMVGAYNQAYSHSILVKSGASSNLQLWDPAWSQVIDSSLALSSIVVPTYIGVWWDHTNTVYRMYTKQKGSLETVDSSSSQSAGSAGTTTVWIGGNQTNIQSFSLRCHNFSVERGELTEAHRLAVYAAAGIE